LWNTEAGVAAAQLNGDIAPPPDDNSTLKTPNVVQLDNNTYFVVKYADGKPSELWDDAGMKQVSALDGDMEGIVALDDGYFFVRYADNPKSNAIWQTKTGQIAEPAEDVVAVAYDNGIFALRRDLQYDEIWTTDPFAKVTQVVGRVESVTTLTNTPYFVIRYTGQGGAEIWQNIDAPEKVYTFRGPIDISAAYGDGKFFFVRYKDQSPSEVWSTSPLQAAAILNGNLQTLQIPTVLADEIVIIDYSDNAVSDVWSLKDGERVAQLNGNVQKINSIFGDVFFTVQYEGDQPAEVWSAVVAQKLATLGDQKRVVKAITPLKDGKYLVVSYEDAPAELWSVADSGVTPLGMFNDVVKAIYPFEQGDYFVVNYLNTPAQIWPTGGTTPLVGLRSDVASVSYNTETKRLGLVASDNHSYELNFDRLLQASDESATSSDSDLLALACQQMAENAPIAPDVLSPYLGGVPPSACNNTAPSSD
jgi:WD40 repeat protein